MKTRLVESRLIGRSLNLDTITNKFLTLIRSSSLISNANRFFFSKLALGYHIHADPRQSGLSQALPKRVWTSGIATLLLPGAC